MDKINTFSSLEDLKEGVVLLVDKPLEWTSFDVVNKIRGSIRRHFNLKKIYVGHAGNLDPLDTGLLVICVGKMTKQIQYLTADSKTYEAILQLGATTPSFDLETEIDQEYPFDHIQEADVLDLLSRWEGPHEQTPPVFSAKKVDGVRAYKQARKGVEVKMKKQMVELHSLELLQFNLPSVSIKVDCSKGTYIRSLAHDIGKALNSGAHLTKLHRTRSGDFNMDQSITLEEFQNILSKCPVSEPES
ncbi:MAG: tRNA pseudouridine(55) synthase TruB [Flavobacteriales bacterium]|nr:tRNA pseudouridine(55) synthase TruB [Flavobacteriales bacterium]